MEQPKLSILISSHDRAGLFRRCLWSIAYRGPRVPFEVVVADDGSADDIPGLLGEFTSCFPWTFVRADLKAFEERTGVRPYFNNPALTNNLAFAHARGELIALMGNEVIAWEGVFDALLEGGRRALAFSTTYDLRQEHLDRLDEYGANLTQGMVDAAARFPLQSEHYRSDVTNYLSLSPRKVWEAMGGYDERYVGGISSDDSDFVRRARALGCKTTIVGGVSLHQFHSGKTTYYDPPESVITRERWDEGVRLNHEIYHAWDGGPRNPQPWPAAAFGVGEVRTNWRAS